MHTLEKHKPNTGNTKTNQINPSPTKERKTTSVLCRHTFARATEGGFANLFPPVTAQPQNLTYTQQHIYTHTHTHTTTTRHSTPPHIIQKKEQKRRENLFL